MLITDVCYSQGSLLARIVFQPIEETLRIYFSRLLGSSNGNANKKQEIKETHQEALSQSLHTLRALLSTQMSISLVLVSFGPAYLPILLALLLPPQYLHTTSAPRILAAWVWYTPFLMINGGLEAFVSSTANRKEVGAQSR